MANKIDTKMNLKAATKQRKIKIGRDLISIGEVKGDGALFRVMINDVFSGYLQYREGEYFRLAGSAMHDLIFARICDCLERGICI